MTKFEKNEKVVVMYLGKMYNTIVEDYHVEFDCYNHPTVFYEVKINDNMVSLPDSSVFRDPKWVDPRKNTAASIKMFMPSDF